MPYADRQQQLTYMRKYMKRKRMEDRLVRLKQRKQELLKRFEEEPAMKYFIKKKEVGSYLDKQIEELEGLLKNQQTFQFQGVEGKP
jgi:hypothetical protein